MKKLFILSIFMIVSFGVFSQSNSEAYSNKTSSDIQLYFYFETKEFKVTKSQKMEKDAGDGVSMDFLLEGTIESEFEDNPIVCKRNGEYFTLKRVGEYLLINYNMPYLRDSLYCTMKSYSDERFHGRWKDGKKHDWWYVLEKNRIYGEEYKDGKLISTKKIK